MTKLLVVFAASLVLAYISEQNTRATIAAGHCYSVWHDWAYIPLVAILTLFAGLRTNYNDTAICEHSRFPLEPQRFFNFCGLKFTPHLRQCAHFTPKEPHMTKAKRLILIRRSFCLSPLCRSTSVYF